MNKTTKRKTDMHSVLNFCSFKKYISYLNVVKCSGEEINIYVQTACKSEFCITDPLLYKIKYP